MSPVLLGGAAAGALLLAALWALVRARGPRRIDAPDDAAAAADAALPGFRTARAVLGADGLAALAVAEDGRVGVCRRRGGRIAVKEVPWSALRSTADGVVVETGDRRFGRVALAGVDALDVRRLAPA